MILELKSDAWIKRHHPKCAVGKDCDRTVEVGGHCYKTHEVNYALWGRIHALCEEYYLNDVGQVPESIGLKAAIGMAAAWKTAEYGEAISKNTISWIMAGYYGYTGHAKSAASSPYDKKCPTCCGKASLPAMHYRWADHQETPEPGYN